MTRGTRRYDVPFGLAAGVLLLTSCSGDATSSDPPRAERTSTPSTSSAPSDPPTTTSPTETDSTIPDPPVPGFSVRRAMATIRVLAASPRLATGPDFRRAARYVRTELASQGYDVSQQLFPVPAGDSWGVPAAAGTSANVVARPVGFDPGSPYVLVGAHLDTVAVSPGAEDNASGVAVLLETARRVAASPRPLPVVFVAFGGEEPRGEGDLDHHFGSVHYVEQMTPVERRNLRGMVAMDRVGVGALVPLGSVPGASTRVRDELARAASSVRVDTVVGENNVSDHESFADEGMPAARMGGTEYRAYHTAADLPHVVDREQLRRVGRVLWAWLGSVS